MAVMFLLLMLMDEDARICVLLPRARGVVGRGGLCVTFVVTFEFYSRV